MILSRRRIIRNKDDKLPYDAEIEYLQSSGTQYIDTNIHFTANHKIDIDFIGLTDGNLAVFGANNGNTATSGELALFWYVRGGTHIFQYVFPTTSNNVSTYVTANTSYDVGTRYHVVFDKTQFVVNDASESCAWYENYICSRTMLIGATNRNNAAVISSMKLFRVKIYESGVLVFDGIPVRKGSVGYLYDRVSKKLFGNAGTGDFILGQDIVEVDYLEGSGTQYINSGIIGTSNVSVDLICTYPKSTNNTALGFIWGSRIGINNAEYGMIHSYIKNYRFAKTNSQNWVAQSDYTLRFTNTEQGNVLKGYDLDNNLIVTLTATFETFNSNNNIYIFAMNANGTANIGSGIKIYRFKMFDSGSLVRDFVPVRVGTIGYMLDKVEHKLYGNAGSGDFIIGSDVKLPYDAKVEYLESDGAAHIDSGIECTGDLVVQFEGMIFDDNTTYTSIHGGVGIGSNGAYFRHHWVPSYYGSNSNQHFFYNISNGPNVNVGPAERPANKWYKVNINPIDGIAKVNGINYSFTPISASLTTNRSYGIMNIYYNDGRVAGKRSRLKYFKFWRNGVLLRDFIPVRIGQTGYLYDKVSRKLFGNSGSGEFLLGNDIVEVEYLETTGTQYINTGIKPSSNTTFEIDAYIPNHGTQGFWVFGSRVSGNAGQFAYLNDGDRNEKSWRFGSASLLVTPKLSEGLHHFNNTETPRVLKIDSNITLTANANTFAQTDYPIYLFTLNVNGTPATANIASGARIGNVKIYESGVLVFDGIPVRVEQVGYMYDRVSGTLFGNAGTGNFILGNDKKV